ncbi:hypothetical protein [Streptomyces canus]|uniref:Uncharacterized protein n=1 Tax=Streptomyces canus TaxID=58343 RepID=A0AAW8FL78_9ACTN|nr:hypothetical protein [Streptomyces canus]MDQ0910569.1 hypothetical protein [Streptomyces canus]MDQ1070586.1 hypothetical protein [Streptomyces canus]
MSPGGAPLPAATLAPNGTFTFGHTLLGTTVAKARLGWGFVNETQKIVSRQCLEGRCAGITFIM